ncbi:MAG: malonyl-CoA decarboxylase family protein [Pseudomonadota bacterium]|nr:malonyl-CoA decarboxylase family protein [Pseudomonadota bacterium]
MTQFLQDLMTSIAECGRRLLDFSGDAPTSDADLEALSAALLSSLGEASGVAMADQLLRAYEARDRDCRAAFLESSPSASASLPMRPSQPPRPIATPPARRLYAFFHPRLVDEPLIFVQVALTGDMPDTVESILVAHRAITDPNEARTAVFYSINNCQEGLRGISFGNFLTKQMVEDLRRELPSLRSFVTLSPVPGFSRWLDEVLESGRLDPRCTEALGALRHEEWWREEQAPNAWSQFSCPWRRIILHGRAQRPPSLVDPVARFHLGNGAQLERINWRADLSGEGLKRSHGIMVNNSYRLEHIERNHEAFANMGEVATSSGVARFARALPSPPVLAKLA